MKIVQWPSKNTKQQQQQQQQQLNTEKLTTSIQSLKNVDKKHE